MNNKTVILTTSFVAGMLFFCLYQEWLVISWHRPCGHQEATSPLTQRTIQVGRKKNNEWIPESVQILWSDDPQQTLKTITNAWLSWLEDEQILQRKITVESVLFSPSGYEAYISFDHNPFEKYWSTHQKESFITDLIKNYKENGCSASSLYFLVHHEPLEDNYLDFNEPWPLVNPSL
jgi:hypothetical protein